MVGNDRMKTILSPDTMDIPNNVIKMKAKVIEAELPRGKLSRNFKHLNLDFQLITDEETGKKKLKMLGSVAGKPQPPFAPPSATSPISSTALRKISLLLGN
ncbi:hypothetical protein DH2020_026850 [Rehmannia glutinosa]|uniref:Uncharacterized protein n=1 Tax=Rehmannia glutinosa TaxID=99300 RepID=A0ABR0VVS9_REHGL